MLLPCVFLCFMLPGDEKRSGWFCVHTHESICASGRPIEPLVGMFLLCLPTPVQSRLPFLVAPKASTSGTLYISLCHSIISAFGKIMESGHETFQLRRFCPIHDSSDIPDAAVYTHSNLSQIPVNRLPLSLSKYKTTSQVLRRSLSSPNFESVHYSYFHHVVLETRLSLLLKLCSLTIYSNTHGRW